MKYLYNLAIMSNKRSEEKCLFWKKFSNNNRNDFDNKEEIILAPMDGKVIDLKNVNNSAFSEGILGDGLAIEPSSSQVVSLVDGVVSMLYDTCHGAGLSSESGVEILIHVGMDTVELNGEGFTSRVASGQKIKKGNLLLEVDFDFIKSKGYDIVTPIVVTNMGKYKNIRKTNKTDILKGEELFHIS